MSIRSRRLRLLALVPVAVLAVALSGCATKFSGNGTFSSHFFRFGANGLNVVKNTNTTNAPQASFNFYYHQLDPNTGAGQLVGSYSDPGWQGYDAGFVPNTNPTVTGPLGNYVSNRNNVIAQGGLQLSFNNAPSDLCYAFTGIIGVGNIPQTSCNGLIQAMCQKYPSFLQQECISYFAEVTGSCMDSVFNYNSTNPLAPGSGQGILVACDGLPNMLGGSNAKLIAVLIPYGLFSVNTGPLKVKVDNVLGYNPYAGYASFGVVNSGTLQSLDSAITSTTTSTTTSVNLSVTPPIVTPINVTAGKIH